MGNIAKYDTIRTIPLASLTASYQALGTAFGHAVRLVHFVNNTNGDMMVSFDGINDNVVVPANTGFIHDLTSNEDSNEKVRLSQGTQALVKYLSAPTTPADGGFYLSCVYTVGE